MEGYWGLGEASQGLGEASWGLREAYGGLGKATLKERIFHKISLTIKSDKKA